MNILKYILFIFIITLPLCVVAWIKGIEDLSVGFCIASTLVPWLLYYALIRKVEFDKYAMTLYFAIYILYYFFLAVVGMPQLWKVTGVMVIMTLIAWFADWIGASEKLLKTDDE